MPSNSPDADDIPEPRPGRLRRVGDRLMVLGSIGTLISICADGADLVAAVLSTGCCS